MSKCSQFLLATFLFFFSSGTFAVETGMRDSREIGMAEDAIFWSRIAAVGEYGKRACETDYFACSDDRADLGLALIASKNSEVSFNSLAKIVRYKIDAGLAEDYTCYVLSKGRPMLKPLDEVNSKTMELICKDQFEKEKINNHGLLTGISVNNVCNSAAAISGKIASLVEGITKGKKCADGDF